MRILVLSLYNGQVHRGAESWTYQFFKTMKNKGVDIILVQGGENKSELVKDLEGIVIEKTLAKDLSGDNSFIGKVRKRLKIHPSQLLVNQFSKKCVKYLLQYKPDWILPSNGNTQLFQKIIQKEKMKTKIFFIGHAGVVSDLKHADVFFALSSRDKDLALQKYPHLKAFYIPNGVEKEIFIPQKYKEETIIKPFCEWEHPRILCVSALVEYKRVLLAVQAFGELEKGSMLILGDGPEKENILRYIQNHFPQEKQKKIQILSHIDFKKVPAFYDWCDVFVHPAKASEAFGNVIIEAMAMGKPLVLNDDPVRREIAGEIGLYVNPENRKDFASKIKEAFEKSQDNSFTTKILARAKLFFWDKIGERYLSLFRELSH